MLRGPALYPTATERFFAENVATVRTDSSREKYRWVLSRLQRRNPGKRTSEFAEADLVDFLTKDENGGARENAPATIAGYRTPIISFFEWAEAVCLVDDNPAKQLKRRIRPRVHTVRKANWLSEAEIGELLRTGAEDDIRARRDRVVIALALFSGLRVHELSWLGWDHVLLQQGTLHVFGKGEKPAVQPIPKNLVEELFSWRSLYAAGLGHPVHDQCVLITIPQQFRGKNNPIRVPKWGVSIGKQGLRQIVQRHGERLGYVNLAPHDLRRSYAGVLEAKGVDLRTIQKLMRHNSIATTQRYLEGNPLLLGDSVDDALGGIQIGGA